MSIDFCNTCDHVVEGNTHTEKDENGYSFEACDICNEEVWGLREDAPEEDDA